MNTKSIVNICSPDRSGSTFLDMILGNDESSISIGEVHAFFRPWKMHHRESLECACGFSDCEIWRGLNRKDEKKFHDYFLKTLNYNFVIDSSKSPEWVFDMNKQSSKKYSVYNIVLYKSPKDLIYSYYKRGKWQLGVETYFSYYQMIEQINVDYYVVSYDDLITKRVETLKKLCSHIGMAFFADKDNFTDPVNKKHHLFGSGGIIKQLKKQSTVIQPTTFTKEFNRWWNENQGNINKEGLFQIHRTLEMKKNRFSKTKQIKKMPFWLIKLKIKRFIKYNIAFRNRTFFIR